MSAASLRARLETAVTERGAFTEARATVRAMETLVRERHPGVREMTVREANSDLIAHAPADLRLALDVIEAATEIACCQPDDIDPRLDYVYLQPGRDDVTRLVAALAAFEAAP